MHTRPGEGSALHTDIRHLSYTVSPVCVAYGVVRVYLTRRMEHHSHPSRSAVNLQYSDHNSGQWGSKRGRLPTN